MTKREAIIVMSKSEDEVSKEEYEQAQVVIANAAIDGYILVNGLGLRSILQDKFNTINANKIFNELTR